MFPPFADSVETLLTHALTHSLLLMTYLFSSVPDSKIVLLVAAAATSVPPCLAVCLRACAELIIDRASAPLLWFLSFFPSGC